MGLFDQIEGKPEVTDNDLVVANQDPLPEITATPETAEETLVVASQVRKDIEEEEGLRFGNPVDFAEQFNNTLISAVGAPVDMMTWAINKGSNAVFGRDLVDPETAVGGTRQLKSSLNPVGIGSDEAPDTYMGYTGQTFGEAAAFLAAGAGVAAKAKQAKGVVGAIAKEADTALKTKLDAVVAVEAAAAVGMAAGRQYAQETEMGTTGALLTEFATGALSLVSAAAAKKAILDPLTAKLKNMNPKEALEKLSKEEVAEVVAEGQRVIAKEEPTPKKVEEAPEVPATTAEPTPAPRTDAEIDALSDDELLEALGVDTTEEVSQTFKAKADIEDAKVIESGRRAQDNNLELLPEELKSALNPFKDDIDILNLTLGENVIGLDKIFISKSQRGQGKGEQVLRKILEYADSKGMDVVLTPSGVGKDKASKTSKLESFYRRLGFTDNTDAVGKQKLIRKAKEAPAPKTPEAAPKADPTSASEDAIDIAIKETRDILTGDRSGGKGAQVTRRVKKVFRQVAREFHDDISELIKTGDVAVAKKILGRIDKYIEFDRVISEKDYAQGSELVANRRNAMEFEFRAGISAAGNKRTEDLTVLKGMLQKFTDEGVEASDDVLKGAKADAKKSAKGAPKISKEEKLDAIADQVAKTFVEQRGGVFQQAIDAYFTFRLVQMLNSAKTSFIGIPSAIMMSVVRPIINTPYNIRKATQAKGITPSRKAMYASADIASTFEYIHTMAKYHKDIARSVVDTIKNKGDSAFLYRDRHAYVKDEIAEAGEPAHAAKRRMKEAQRRVRAREANTETGRRVLNAKATVLNSKTIKLPLFFYDYGVSLIGGLEEISIITHALRDARARGIKKAIDAGDSNILKSSSDYMESAIDRSGGGFRANYDPEFADIFNTARKDHFRAMDLDPNDIRRDVVDGMVAAVNKVSSNPDEMGILARMLMVFVGVPLRAGGVGLSYTLSPLNVAKNVAGGGARRFEKALGGKATFGKYNKKISELEIEIKGQKKLLKSEDPDVKATAEKKLAELEDSLAFTKDLKMQKDYEDIGKLAIGTSLFLLGYEMAKNGQTAGTDAWMTEEQKLAAQKVQGAPNSWKVVLGGNEFDFRYFDPLKGVFALGADYARRQAAEEAGALTDEQTFAQFVTSYTKSIATDSPFATGARYVTQLMSPNPETQERGIMGIYRSLIPVPAEIRHFNKFDEEFVTDTTAGEFFDTTLSASIGLETGNYRLTSLGEPKLKEEPSILSYILPYGPKAVPEREPIDDILLEDAMSFRSVTSPQTSVGGFKLKQFVNEDNETAYSLYGRLISETRIGGKNQRQALNQLVKTTRFKNAYKKGYEQNEQGTEVNEGIEMIKEVISEYRAAARKKLLESKVASEYVDGDGNNIYDIAREREQFSERPESLLETLNLK